MSDEEREAMRVAFCEQEEEWRAALDAYHNKPGPRRLERLAAEWILIFAGEEWGRTVIAGLPIGHVLDDLRKQGLELPPEIQPLRDQWHANIVAYDMQRRPSERTTQEGKQAAIDDYKAWKRRQRELKAKRMVAVREERQ